MKAKIVELLDSIHESRLSVLLDLVIALNSEITYHFNPKSNLISEIIALNFGTRLLLHHATTEEIFKKKKFEYAFVEAMKLAGKNALINENSTHPGEDILVDGTKFSLKTEASENLNLKSITISKFMEARFIRECATQRDFKGALKNIFRHLAHYERLLMLRGRFIEEQNKFEYCLVEIPLSLLEKMASLRANDFSPRTANGSSSAAIYDGSEKLFTLRFDGSVEKITLSGILMSRCMIHATWSIPNLH